MTEVIVTREHLAGLELALESGAVTSPDMRENVLKMVAQASAAPEQEAVLGDPVGSFEKHMEYMRRCIELEKKLAEAQALLREWGEMFHGAGISSGPLTTLRQKNAAFLSATAQPAEVKS